ncbi:FRINGE-RELATED [Salix purpurea]|uniref:FRINGE-RELATED n=1 Tax=Salix purpurea TaxID=77065 RepID=A0A9Q0UQS6_SALPP|nr:FRINGE-RELATED [Salix purpurea]
MKLRKLLSVKSKSPSWFINLAIGNVHDPTTLDHIVFGIASNNKSWPRRKEYVKLWWKPDHMRGCVFLDSMVEEANSYNDSSSLPPVCISEDTSRFRYTFRNGLRSAIRVARVVFETVALNHSDVRWFVFGDDDTVFLPENLVKTLSKYDHELWYYIGSNSEIYEQNRQFGFEMAFGGGGFAISYPLAKVLARVFDACIERYPHLYGSDSRIYSCLAELGVGLTHEPGFHQFDIRGDSFGLLTSHPLAPLSAMIVGLGWTFSVSWGYAVEVYSNHVFLPDILPVQQTFRQWKRGDGLARVYTFNTREPHPELCRRPTIFFLDHASSGRDRITSLYKKSFANCSNDMAPPRKLEEIKVYSQKLDLSDKQLRAPRRQCCDVLPPSSGEVMELAIRECKEEERIYMH